MTGPALEGELVDDRPGVALTPAGPRHPTQRGGDYRPPATAALDVRGPGGLLPAYADNPDPDERVPLDVDQALRDAIPKTTWAVLEYQWARFVRWCGATGRRHDPPTVGTIRTYIWAHLTWTRRDGVTLAGRGGAPYAYATVETALGAICMVLKWRGYPSPWGHPGVQAQLRAYDKKMRAMGYMPREAYALTPDEQVAMIRARDMATVSGVRDAAMLALHMATGCRAAELVALDDGDLAWESPTRLLVTIRVGKGGKSRVVPVEADEEGFAPDVDPLVLLGEWQDLKRARGITPGGPLFLECRVGGRRADGTHSGVIRAGVRVTKAAYERVHARAAHTAGVDVDPKTGLKRHVTTHSQRAAYITNATDAGVPIERIRPLTGHSPNSPVVFRYVRSGLRWGDHNPQVQVRRAAAERRRRMTRDGSGS